MARDTLQGQREGRVEVPHAQRCGNGGSPRRVSTAGRRDGGRVLGAAGAAGELREEPVDRRGRRHLSGSRGSLLQPPSLSAPEKSGWIPDLGEGTGEIQRHAGGRAGAPS